MIFKGHLQSSIRDSIYNFEQKADRPYSGDLETIGICSSWLRRHCFEGGKRKN